MKVVQIPNPNGIDDLKLIGETETERQWIRQLAEAGTLASVSRIVGDSVKFRAISITAESGPSSQTLGRSLGTLNFTVVQNENYLVDWKILAAGVPLDLTTFSAIKIAVKDANKNFLFEVSIGSGLTISGPDNNILRVAFTPAQTAMICQVGYYDLLLSKPTSNAYYIKGKISAIKTGTR